MSRRSCIRSICFLLSLLLLCLSFPASATTEEQLALLQSEQATLASQLKAAQDELAIFQSEADLQNTQLSWLNERSEEERDAYEAQLKQITAVTKIKQALDKNLELAILRYEQHKILYGERVTSMFRMQDKSQLEILLESKDLPAYFTTLRLMKMISDSDEQELERLRQERDRLELQKAATESELADLEEIRKSIAADLEAMQNDIEGYESQVSRLGEVLQQKLEAVNQYAAQDAEIQDGIAAMQAQLERERSIAEQAASELQGGDTNVPQYSGAWVWPCPNYTEITSGFGPRCIPEYGINDFHSGLDMAASYDDPVLAAASGIVVCAGWINFGGNTVKIDVGNGTVIWNCHLNSVAVYEGQYVNAGEIVGYVGSTGNSTGPHLHFEVQQGGTSVDPWLYLS